MKICIGVSKQKSSSAPKKDRSTLCLQRPPERKLGQDECGEIVIKRRAWRDRTTVADIRVQRSP